MPYITKARREVFEKAIQEIVTNLGGVNSIVTDDNAAKGELNYVIFSLVKRYLGDPDKLRYARAQDFIGGTLTSCQQELYRRIMGPLEDRAIAKNGDVE
jgi:hypothetical protein